MMRCGWLHNTQSSAQGLGDGPTNVNSGLALEQHGFELHDRSTECTDADWEDFWSEGQGRCSSLFLYLSLSF